MHFAGRQAVNKSAHPCADIKDIREEYRRQKILEKYVTSREIVRPKTKKWHVWVLFVVFLLLIAVSVVFPLAVRLLWGYKVLLAGILFTLVLETYGRFFLIKLVRCYQSYASAEVRRTCKCIPSCSGYAILSLKNVFPLVWALLKIRKRLYVTCNGEEYKLDFPAERLNTFKWH